MEEWIKKITETITAGDIITIVIAVLGCFGSIIGWIKSVANRKSAKASEAKAKEYAENANDCYLKAKEFYDIGAESKKAEMIEFIKQRVIEQYKPFLPNTNYPVEREKIQLILPANIKTEFIEEAINGLYHQGVLKCDNYNKENLPQNNYYTEMLSYNMSLKR